MSEFSIDRSMAVAYDETDPLREFRYKFHIPTDNKGKELIYFCGNSLGLQPKNTENCIKQELSDWKSLGVEGHVHAKNPWLSYHEYLTEYMAEVVGANTSEVVVMNTLSVNLHVMMVSFYRPTSRRHKILIESDAFPSDRYAVESQIKFHGFDPNDTLIELKPRDGEYLLREEDIERTIYDYGEEIALILIGNTNYYTGQLFDMKSIAKMGHEKGCLVGFDCAHGAGNVPLNLHDSGVDFAVWCNYKYLNSGPGSIASCFVNEKHVNDSSLPKFTGWWGHNKSTRFGMRDGFDPIPTVESWQLSNPPILSMAAISASLQVFHEAGMSNLREKSIKLTSYLEFLVKETIPGGIVIISPSDPNNRGAQLSLLVENGNRKLFEQITQKGVIADWREPNVIRIAPTPLYNTFEEVHDFVGIVKEQLENG